MQLLPFILVTVGIICIIISFLLPDKKKKQQREQLTPEERANLIAQGKKEIDGILNDQAENAIEKVDEQLSRISNEKIISVSEYSDQVLEKINQNHQEVVFLYNMLNEKEEEMKKLMLKMKTTSKEDTADRKQIEQLTKRAKEVPDVLQKQDTALQQEKSESAYFEQNEIQNNEDIEMLKELIYRNEDQTKVEYKGQEIQQNLGQTEENLSKQVIEMYQSGRSILEISKQLHKGQGEVRLIIDLYAKR